MKTCFVSMPLGTRHDPQTGVTVDFDRVYAELLAPAIAQTPLELRSWRTGVSGTARQKQALSDVMSCDVLVADLTTANPNVMYELGVRHAANRGPTVLMRAGSGHAPFYVGFLETIVYDPLEDLAHPDALRERLTQALRTAARRAEGSPLYVFFPSLRVELPEDLLVGTTLARPYPDLVKASLTASRAPGPSPRRSESTVDFKLVEETLRDTSDAAPAAYLDLLRAYRDKGDWNALISAADALPPEIKDDPQTMQLVALALNRRANAGDQEQAIALMHQLVEETGGDAETLLILGRIYKDRWKQDEDPAYLQKAADYYRRGFDLQPTDYYSGFNAASLAFIQHTPAGDEQVAALLPRVKAAIEPELARRDVRYTTCSTAIEIAVMERHWAEADTLVARALELAPLRDMRITSADSIARLGRRLEGTDAEALARLIAALRNGRAQMDADHADL